MTRETKIGLLVGLAFIIVIGILLSDYNRNEIQGATLPLIADNVRSSTATLRNGSNQNEVVPPPAPVLPKNPVPTHDDLHQPSAVVDISPGPSTTLTPGNGDGHSSQISPPVVAATDEPHGPVAGTQTPSGATPAIPDTIAVFPHRAAPSDAPTAPAPPVAPATPTVNGARQYVAVAGDTVSKLAGRYLGANTKTNREAILAINPSLKSNPNNVIVGKTYMIPPLKSIASANASAPAEHPVAVVPTTPLVPGPADAVKGPFYVVKENDNLWKIAAVQLGDGSAWEAIKELNKDILKGRDDVRPNMRLRLPPKSVASAN